MTTVVYGKRVSGHTQCFSNVYLFLWAVKDFETRLIKFLFSNLHVKCEFFHKCYCMHAYQNEKSENGETFTIETLLIDN